MSSPTNDRAPASPAASDGSSSDSSAPPSTPPLSTPLPMPTFMNLTSEDAINGVPSLAGVKRTIKNTRRVNTAEKRASHNAVERARRETLNGRFLDLAALLPNLHTIRRPSKSAIVNSSIAHLNASRRHRILAAQTLRAIKDETDALRHEINQWRARAGIQGLEEPIRGDEFGVILSGELEFEQSDMLDGSEEGEGDEDGYRSNMPGPYSAADPAAENYAMHAHLAQMHPHNVGYSPEMSPMSPQAYYHGRSPVYENPAAGYYEPAVEQQQQWAAAAAYEKERLPYPPGALPVPVRPNW
ncbi:BHLH domain-containing protein [Mycena chlorophos]|uniref:BHLH domain-containing protein n=1 Tax=Mycena chlorophos TaxID=658473 RepID=A0A8H6VQX4_MYCCL|nr:BHLH domain-containing protein [Mycena chlorophos]